MNKLAFGLILIVLATAGLSACNTVAGAGHDIKDAGQGIENTANDHKPNGDK